MTSMPTPYKLDARVDSPIKMSRVEGFDGGTQFAVQTNWQGWELRRSRGNLRSLSELGSDDVGGDFDLSRRTFSLQGDWSPRTIRFGSYQRTGNPVWANWLPWSWGTNNPKKDVVLPATGTLLTQGTKAIALCSPTRPKAGLSSALIELKNDGLPSASLAILKNRGVKGAGSDYLNVNFGWLPLVSDLKSVAKSVINTEKYLKALREYSGQKLRRRFVFVPVETESIRQTYSPGYYTGPWPLGHREAAVEIKTAKTEVWFSGAFRYGYPMGDDLISKASAAAIDARYLLGLDLSPSTIWNVLPWSWLADWFVNVGDIMSNMSDSMYNQQVLEFGYVMRTVTETTFHELTVQGPLANFVCGLSSTYVSKQRRKATPYGFGLSWTGFTPYQLSILTALGISNRRGS